MKYIVNLAKHDEQGKVIDRVKIGEYDDEFEALMVLSDEDKKLKGNGVKDTVVEILHIQELSDVM